MSVSIIESKTKSYWHIIWMCLMWVWQLTCVYQVTSGSQSYDSPVPLLHL